MSNAEPGVCVVTPELTRLILSAVSIGQAPTDVLDGGVRQIKTLIKHPDAAVYAMKSLLETYESAKGEVSPSDLTMGALVAISLIIGSSDEGVRQMLTNLSEASAKVMQSHATTPQSDVNKGEVF
jgi:hypothetical protein